MGFSWTIIVFLLIQTWFFFYIYLCSFKSMEWKPAFDRSKEMVNETGGLVKYCIYFIILMVFAVVCVIISYVCIIIPLGIILLYVGICATVLVCVGTHATAVIQVLEGQ